MALPYIKIGTGTRSAGVISALIKQRRFINLKPAKKITFTFDPFSDCVCSIRELLDYFYHADVRKTNLKCSIKTDIINTRVNPFIDVHLDSGENIIFKTKNLSALEVLKIFNELISANAPPVEESVLVEDLKVKGKKRK